MFRRLLKDSRSYGGFKTNSDHKAVITKLKLKRWKVTKKETSKQMRIEVENLSMVIKKNQRNLSITKKF